MCAGGRVAGVYRKRFLPNYGVFDEQRWFGPSDEPPTLFGIAGAWVGVSICEDVWFDDGPVAQAGRAGADVVVNLNASPTTGAGGPSAWPCCEGRVAEAGCAIAYVNQVGGQDELVFDGDSLVVAADGTLLGHGRAVRRGPRRGRPPGRACTRRTPSPSCCRGSQVTEPAGRPAARPCRPLRRGRL